MRVIYAQNAQDCWDSAIQALKDGKLLAYPTDTVYGLGCDATSEEAVERVYAAKRRDAKPVSVIAPSKDWVLENCTVSREDLDKYLPGAYTLVLDLRNLNCVAGSVLQGRKSLGVRIPSHWFSEIVSAYGKPVVTTSLNLSREPTVKRLEDLPESIAPSLEMFIYEKPLTGSPSTLVMFEGGKAVEVKR